MEGGQKKFTQNIHWKYNGNITWENTTLGRWENNMDWNEMSPKGTITGSFADGNELSGRE
jgi:hypothetical protein